MKHLFAFLENILEVSFTMFHHTDYQSCLELQLYSKETPMQAPTPTPVKFAIIFKTLIFKSICEQPLLSVIITEEKFLEICQPVGKIVF